MATESNLQQNSADEFAQVLHWLATLVSRYGNAVRSAKIEHEADVWSVYVEFSDMWIKIPFPLEVVLHDPEVALSHALAVIRDMHERGPQAK